MEDAFAWDGKAASKKRVLVMVGSYLHMFFLCVFCFEIFFQFILAAARKQGSEIVCSSSKQNIFPAHSVFYYTAVARIHKELTADAEI